MTTKTLNKGDLTKGLAVLAAIANGATSDRASELFQKSREGTLTPEERDELVKSLSGEGTLAAKAVEPIQKSEAVKQHINVSDYLREQTKAIVEGLSLLGETIQKSSISDQEFRKSLAITVLDVGNRVAELETMVKSVQEKIGVVAQQPARPPKSQGATGAQPLNKAFGGAETAADQLSKSQILDGLDAMALSGVDRLGGHKIENVVAKYESTNLLDKSVRAEVEKFVKSQKSKAA